MFSCVILRTDIARRGRHIANVPRAAILVASKSSLLCRRDKLAANCLAFIQCPLRLWRLTAPECSLRTKCWTQIIPPPLNDSGTAAGAFWRLWPPFALGTINAPCESLRLLEHPKGIGRVSASPPLRAIGSRTSGPQGSPRKTVAVPSKTLRSPLVAVWAAPSWVAEGGANES
jgi:hypothetical protein